MAYSMKCFGACSAATDADSLTPVGTTSRWIAFKPSTSEEFSRAVRSVTGG